MMKGFRLIFACLLLVLNLCLSTAQASINDFLQLSKDSVKKISWSLDQDSNIVFTLTSDGTTGEQWITRLESKGFRVGDYAKGILMSKDFKATTGVTYQLIAMKSTAFKDTELSIKNIRSRAKEAKWQAPNPEVGCLIRENFSDEEIEVMGLWYLVTMHDPINDFDGRPRLFRIHRLDGGSWLDSYWYNPDFEWLISGAFVFVLSQVPLKP